MIPTKEAVDQLEHDRWNAPPEVQASLEFEVALLTAAPAKGVLSDLEMCFQTYSNRNQRNHEVEQIVFRRFKDRHPDQWIFFTADCPDNGACRFQMRVAARQEDVRHAPAARFDFEMNLMKPHDEWIKPPSQSRAPAQTDRRAGGGESFHASKDTPMSQNLATRAKPTRTK